MAWYKYNYIYYILHILHALVSSYFWSSLWVLTECLSCNKKVTLFDQLPHEYGVPHDRLRTGKYGQAVKFQHEVITLQSLVKNACLFWSTHYTSSKRDIVT